MGSAGAIGASGQIGWSTRSVHEAGDPRCHLLRQPYRLFLALPTNRFSALDDGLHVFPRVEAVGRVHPTERSAPRTGPWTCRQKSGTDRGDHRFPERQDFRKRGARGYDGGKKIKGRKRHLIVDTLGLLLKVKVLPANLSDREGGKQLLEELHNEQPALKLHLYADGGYQGKWEAWVKSTLDFTVEIVKRSDFNVRGYWLPAGQELTEEQIKTFRGYRSFEVVKKRWIVERSIAWMTFQRRLNREYDLLPDTTEAWVMLTFIRLMIRRLAQPPVQFVPSQAAA